MVCVVLPTMQDPDVRGDRRAGYDDPTVFNIYTIYSSYFYSTSISGVLLADPGPDHTLIDLEDIRLLKACSLIGTSHSTNHRTGIPLFSNYFPVITASIRILTVILRTFCWRRTIYHIKRVRPTRAAEKGAHIGRISTRDSRTLDRIDTGSAFHRAAGTRPNEHLRDNILLFTEIL